MLGTDVPQRGTNALGLPERNALRNENGSREYQEYVGTIERPSFVAMLNRVSRLIPSSVLPAAVVTLTFVQAAHAADTPRFESDILPVFKARCLACHSGATPQAGLDLSTRESVIAGGKSGPAVVPGSSEKSLLVEKVLSKTMPPVEP